MHDADVVCAVFAFVLRDMALVPIPGTAPSAAPIAPERAEAVFEPLHANLYRAFDYTDESDIYDALEMSVSGPLLESLYKQIYQSLIDAENDGLLGVVTGVDPIGLEVLESPAEAGPDRFDVRHRWRVAGTVYHWGHSHTRVNEYEADYVVEVVDGAWRITGNMVREQRRLDAPPARPVEI